MTQIITPAIKGKECRFAVYVPPPEYGMPDYHLIKENIVYEDGTSKPNVVGVRNFQRPFWTTRKGAQNHKQKKEWEKIENLIQGKSTQSTLVDNIYRALGEQYKIGKNNPTVRQAAASPYLYGADILSTAIIKKTYQDKYPIETKYSVAVFDTETDVINGTNQIIMGTVTYKKVVYTVVQKDFLLGIANAQERVSAMMDKYLGEFVESRKLVSEMVIVDSELDVVALCMGKAHELKPDFLAIWNLDFDIGKIIDACDRRRVDPKTIFSDPIVPKEYQYFKYIQGPKQKVTASGLVTPIKPAAQWHTVVCPASFYIIDAMCAYKHVRIGKPEEQSYSLDAILNKELGMRKLKFEEASHIKEGTLQWHQYMQKNHKLEYIIYNRWDCISMEVLDEKIEDLTLTLPKFSGFSDFMNFKSQPRRTVDTLHYYCLEHGLVIGTTSSEMNDEMDKETVGLDGWIVTLPAHLVADNGLCLIAEHPNMRTNVRAHVGDLDVSASYPNGQCVFNISKATTKKEITSIKGIDLQTQKMQGINLSGGHTNAVEFCTTMFKFPQLETLLEFFEMGDAEPFTEIPGA